MEQKEQNGESTKQHLEKWEGMDTTLPTKLRPIDFSHPYWVSSHSSIGYKDPSRTILLELNDDKVSPDPLPPNEENLGWIMSHIDKTRQEALVLLEKYPLKEKLELELCWKKRRQVGGLYEQIKSTANVRVLPKFTRATIMAALNGLFKDSKNEKK